MASARPRIWRKPCELHSSVDCRTFLTTATTSLVCADNFSFIWLLTKRVIWCQGAVLDPRFKKNWIKYSGRAESDVLSGVRSQLELRYRALCNAPIKLKVKTQFNWFIFDQGQRGEVADDRPEVRECVGTPPTKRSVNRSLYSTFLEAVPVASGVRMRILTEFETFINEPVSPWEEAADATSASTDPQPLYPLKFWKSNAARLPLLSLVARDVFGIPASSGSIRRLLSAATDIQDAVSNRTDADLFERMMFVKHNIHHLRQNWFNVFNSIQINFYSFNARSL